MLRKLLKYDLRAGFGILGLLYAGLAGLFLFGLLFKALEVQQLMMSMVVAMVLVGIAMIILAIVFVVMRYAKGLFGAEGYLYQALPVGKGALLASKAITAYLMLLAGIIGLLLSILCVFRLVDPGILESILKSFADSGYMAMTVNMLVLFLIQLGTMVASIFASITLANTRQFMKNNVVFAVLFYIALNMIIGVLELAGLLLIPMGLRFSDAGASLVFETTLGSMLQMGGQMNGSVAAREVAFGMGSAFVDLAAAVGLLLLTRWLLEKKASVK